MHSWRFNHAQYFCWKREKKNKKTYLCFLSQFEKVSSNICCMFLCPSIAFKWVCSDGLLMLPLEVNIKSWFALFVGLSTSGSFPFWNHSTQMPCMLSDLLFIPHSPKTKWAWHLVNFTLNFINYRVWICLKCKSKCNSNIKMMLWKYLIAR